MKNPLAAKLGLILILSLLLLLGLEMIASTVSERQFFKRAAATAIAKSWTGKQEVMGPVLRIPYTIEWQAEHLTGTGNRTRRESKEIYLTPTTLISDVNIETEIRQKGIFKIPVYTANIGFKGLFELPNAPSHPENAIVTMGQATVGIGIKDARGLSSTPGMAWGGQNLNFAAGSTLKYLSQGVHAPVALKLKTGETVSFQGQFTLRGMQAF